MRKLFVLPIVFAAFFAGFDVYGATARGGRSVASSIGATVKSPENQQKQTTSATVSARTANRTAVRGAPTTNKSSSTVSARAATRTSVARGAVQRVNSGVSVKSASATTARAGVKQKAINLGTKVNVATENTTISKECSDAFNGCMDSFCMIDNASGGRCRCDDRVDELDSALDEIMEINTRSDVIKTDGVKRLQMGEDADAVEAWAKDAAAKTLANDKKNRKDFLNTDTDSKKNKLSLDLDSLGLNLFDVDDLFEEIGTDTEWTDFSDKRGADLRNAAMKMCGSKLPAQCKEDLQMLTSVYGVQIQTNCLAYTNNLKQLKMEAEANYKNAMRDLRDAALVAYNEANKYKTAGQCAVAFKQCMVSEDVCGNGFEKCVINPMLVKDAKAKKMSVDIKTGKNIAFQISAGTYEQLSAQKANCDHVLKQCVNVSKDVWNTFLASIAAEITSAEIAAEDESRRNCAKNVVDCIRSAAKASGFEEGTDGWTYFTQDFENFRNTCKIELEQCDAYNASGTGLKSGIENYVRMALDALRADNCTEAVKKCITDGCGDNYSECVGYTVSDLKQICPSDYLDLYCSGKEGYENNIYTYVDSVAQGLFLNVHNDLLEKCLKSVNTAVNNASYAMEELDFNAILDTNLSYNIARCVPSRMVENDKEELEKEKPDSSYGKGIEDKERTGCDGVYYELENISALSEADATCPKWQAVLDVDNFDMNQIKYDLTKTAINYKDSENDAPKTVNTPEDVFEVTKNTDNEVLASIKNKMNSAYKNLVQSIESDINVASCMNGGTIQGFSKNANITRTGLTGDDGDSMIFRNLTSNARATVAETIYNRFMEQYSERISDLQEEIDTANGQINKLYEESRQVCLNDNNVRKAAKCTYGDCNGCKDAKAKCECIAATYFQYGVIVHNSGNNGEYTVVNSYGYNDNTKYCTVQFTHVKDVPKDKLAETSFGSEGKTDNYQTVKFLLEKNTEVSISGCVASKKNRNENRGYGDVLTIGDQAIKFQNCSAMAGPLYTYPDDGSKQPYRGEGACYWCDLDELHKDDNTAYVTQGASGSKGGSFIELDSK